MTGKKIDKNFATYDQVAIDDWKKSIDNLPLEIANVTKKIQDNQSELKLYQTKLDGLTNGELAHVKKLIDKITAQIHVLTLPKAIKKLSQQLPPLKEKINQEKITLDKVTPIVENYNRKISECERHIKIIELEEHISKLEKDQLARKKQTENLDIEHNQFESSLSDIQAKLKGLELKYDSLVSQSKHYSVPPVYNNNTTIANNSAYFSSQSVQTPYYTSTGSNQSVQQIKYPEIEKERIDLKATMATLKEREKHLQAQIIRVCNQIKDKNSEITTIKNQIESDNSRLFDFNQVERNLAHCKNKEELKLIVTEEDSNKSPYEEQQQKAKLNLNIYQNKLDDLNDSIQSMNIDFKYYSNRTGEFADHHDSNQLNSDLETQRKIQEPLLNQKDQLEETIDDFRTKIVDDKNQLTSLKKQQEKLCTNNFMQNLWYQPQTLIDKIIPEIKNRLNSYELDHPARQSEQVRIAIYAIKKHIDNIQQIVEIQPSTLYEAYTLTSNNGPSSSFQQKKYYQLCGLLWKHLNELKADEDLNFAQGLLSILRDNAIEEEFAIKKFKELDLPEVSLTEVIQQETTDYNSASSHFKTLMDQLVKSKDPNDKLLYHSGISLFNQIENEKQKEFKKEISQFDMKFYTNLFQTAGELAQHHENIETQNRFRKLINHTHAGKPSLGKKILGAGLMFLGIGIVWAGLAQGVGSFIGLPIPFLIPAIVIASGAAIFASGLTLLTNGKDKGIHNEMQNYAKATKHSTFFTTIPSAPPVEEERTPKFVYAHS